MCSNGTEISDYKKKEQPGNLTLINFLPKNEYDKLARGCDAGLIFLDYRFSIPNYPSRILSYMENSTPVICATDPNTDVGKMVEENGFGYACQSNSVESFISCIEKLRLSDIDSMGKRARRACEELFSVEQCYNKIINDCK